MLQQAGGTARAPVSLARAPVCSFKPMSHCKPYITQSCPACCLLFVVLQTVRLSVLDVLVHLTATMGRFLASSSIESMAIAAK